MRKALILICCLGLLWPAAVTAAERSLRLIPKKAPLPVDPSADRATREKKGLELYEYPVSYTHLDVYKRQHE